MDTIIHAALESICSHGGTGLPLPNLWATLTPHLSSNNLTLCPNVKKAIWSNLLNVPSVRFECRGVGVVDNGDVRIRNVEEAERMEVRIVGSENLINNFVGIYDIKASDAGVSERQRKVLERLAIARTDGITQNDLAKELGIRNNDIFYVLKGLESRGLIVRQSTLIRKKEAGNEGEYRSGSIVNTNMLHLYRYAKHLGHLQRLEITKEDKAPNDNEIDDKEDATGDGVSEERIADYVPAIKAICDRLEKATGKVLVVSDLKKELGYCKTAGHRAWRNILKRMKDARLVEDFIATVNEKKVNCLRLLKKFSPKTFVPKSHGGGDDDLDTEHVKLVKRGQITEQLMELPIEQQIYDMIDAEGSKGLIINEVYKRLGINNKRYYPRILEMVSRIGMHIDSESLNRGVAYRVWTSGNYNNKVPSTPPGKSVDNKNEELPTDAQAGQLMLTHSIQDVDDQTPKVDVEASEEQDTNDTLLALTTVTDLQWDTNSITPDAEEAQNLNLDPAENIVSLGTPSSASPAKRIRRSSLVYPCIGYASVHSLREQRILEKLQKDKVLIQAELPGLLESLENQETKMDKKTLERSLNKLQKDGLCKCISFAVPSVTNCGRKRTIDVVLHPSVFKVENLSDRVHDKLRLFEKQTRHQSFLKIQNSKSGSIPVLNDVERIYTNVKDDVQAKTAEAMRNNGFVLAKMVRAKLLHVFLWGFLTESPGWDDAISGKDGFEQKNPHSTCKLFELDAAIKAMPLELFLQVAGSSETLESMVEKCRNGLRLSDLHITEYRSIMGTRATGIISNLIDILRRLKLIRLIGGELDAPVAPHTTLRHAIELKPYIEEPVGMYLPSAGVNSFDLRPHVRHDFVLASRKDVDEYWNTLEYCYAASDPKAALHAFPGSAVHETFLSRSWASARVMTAHQRVELFKLVENDDLTKKITYKKCEKIAENLNLTLEQVLRVYYEKRQKSKIKGETRAKRKRSLKGKQVKTENSLDEESHKPKHAKISTSEDATKEQSSLHETHMLVDNEIDGQKEALDDDEELNEDEKNHSYSAVHQCALSKLQYKERNRFSWTKVKDRLLVIEYVKHRVALGAKFNRTVWANLEGLPAPPNTCRRRMSTLNRNKQFKKAVLSLCNMLQVRYAKHLQNSKDKRRIIMQNQNANGDLVDDGTNDPNEEKWDDFDKEDIKIVLDEALKYKEKSKSEAAKGAQNVSKYRHSDGGGERHVLDEDNIGSSTLPINELKKDSGKKQQSARKSRRRLPKSYAMLVNKGKGFGSQAYKSLAVSNAIELFKLVFLSTAKGRRVPNLLAETLRRYSEHDLLTAFNYLRHRKFMVRGSDANNFVLSQPFLHNISSSPFPVNTRKRAVKMANWLHEKENDLLDTGVYLSPELQCGDILQLSVLMCSGEISMFPCVPDEGVGEIDDTKKRIFDDNETCSVDLAKKPKLLDSEIFSRKGKGFPGIRLSLSCNLVSKVDEITLSTDENTNSVSSEYLGRIIKSNGAYESTWEAMTCYATHLASHMQETSLFNPNLFKTVHAAIQKAGDQGLSMEGISQITDAQGEKMPEIIVEVLEAFGRALKVNAYDSVHVVDSLYRSKYLLKSMGSHQDDSDLEVPDTHTNDGEQLELQQKNREEKGKNIMEETCADPVEVHTGSDKVHHRVTILNHPIEAPQPISEVQANDEINEIETYDTENVRSPRMRPQEEKCEFVISNSPYYRPILPWVNGDGTTNEIVYKGLVRRVLGIVMQNPGILEENVISQMNALNPQSCRKLLELMILDSHITVRKMYQSESNEPPSMLQCLLGSSLKKPKLVCREHLFANPKSISYL